MQNTKKINMIDCNNLILIGKKEILIKFCATSVSNKPIWKLSFFLIDRTELELNLAKTRTELDLN